MKVRIYRNNMNENKYLEVHTDKCYHNWVRPYMSWENGVTNLLGDGNYHQYKINNLRSLLEDYTLIRTTENKRTNYPTERKQYPKGSMYYVEDTVANWKLTSKRKVARMIADNKKNGISIYRIYVIDNNGNVLNSFTEEEWKKFRR